MQELRAAGGPDEAHPGLQALREARLDRRAGQGRRAAQGPDGSVGGEQSEVYVYLFILIQLLFYLFAFMSGDERCNTIHEYVYVYMYMCARAAHSWRP